MIPRQPHLPPSPPHFHLISPTSPRCLTPSTTPTPNHHLPYLCSTFAILIELTLYTNTFTIIYRITCRPSSRLCGHLYKVIKFACAPSVQHLCKEASRHRQITTTINAIITSSPSLRHHLRIPNNTTTQPIHQHTISTNTTSPHQPYTADKTIISALQSPLQSSALSPPHYPQSTTHYPHCNIFRGMNTFLITITMYMITTT